MKIVVLGDPARATLPPSADPDLANYGYCSQIEDLCNCFYKLGYNVIHVGVEGSNIACSQNISVMPKEVWEQHVQKKKMHYEEYTNRYSDNVHNVLNSFEPYSLVVCANSRSLHYQCLKEVKQHVVETGVGYPFHEIWANNKTFFSQAWRNSYYGQHQPPMGQWYDRVIPPCFDIDTFPFESKKDDYFLIVCRLIESKGVHIAAELAKKMGFKLKIAGPGDPKPYLTAPNIEYLGVLKPWERNEVMKKAKAVFQPTLYIEPFGLVIIEANLCGTPVITTDWGAFTENVSQGVTGFRCHNWAEFKKAVNDVDNINPYDCRRWGENYSYEKIAPMYERYFKTLLDLNKDGWYTE